MLRGLGLWTAAARDLIDSIKGFRSLPNPDKKGWASSLSLVADTFQYMSVGDFKQQMVKNHKLRSNHPVLEAILCVEEAARLSIYSPLFYAKNKVGDLYVVRLTVSIAVSNTRSLVRLRTSFGFPCRGGSDLVSATPFNMHHSTVCINWQCSSLFTSAVLPRIDQRLVDQYISTFFDL